MLDFGCSRNVVSHPTRQSRKGRNWVLLWGPCTEAASARFGNLMSKADRDPAGTARRLMELLAKALMGLAPVQSPSRWDACEWSQFLLSELHMKPISVNLSL